MNIQEMLDKNQFEEILEMYLDIVKKYSFNSTKSNKHFKQLNNTICVYYACFNLGYYIDCVILGNKILTELRKTHILLENKINCYHFYLESLLYCLINKVDISQYIDICVSEEIAKLIQHPLIVTNPDNKALLHIYEDFCKGNYPYYILQFLVPYPPLFKNYIFNLEPCFPFISMGVKEYPRILENGEIQDYFTSIEFKIYGFTHLSPDWKGPLWKKRERLPHIKKCLPILNMLFLYAGNATKTFTPTICIEQISSTQISQFSHDGKQINWSMGTDFRSQWVGQNIPKHHYTQEELQQLNEWVINSYGSEVFVSLYQQAKNNISAGLYVESFLLLCSCSESMIYYWCRRLCEILKISDEYDRFSKNKVSACDTCTLFLNNAENKKHHIGIEPSIYQHINYLVDKCNLDKKKERDLKSLVSKVRNDNLRNDIVHGRTNDVSLEIINKSLDSIMALQDYFKNIENELLKNISETE